MLRRIAFIATVVLLFVAAVLFTTLNQQSFEIDLAAVRLRVSSGLALLIAFAAGLLAGALWSGTTIARLLGERGRLPNALRLAEARRPVPEPIPDASGPRDAASRPAAMPPADAA